jgi:hypothetical protein
MRKWAWSLVCGFLIVGGIFLSLNVFASPKTEIRNVSITVLGLPNNLNVEVWCGANKLTSFSSNQSDLKLDVPSKFDKIKFKLESLPSPGVRYVTEQLQYDLKGNEELKVSFKKQYALGYGAAVTGGDSSDSEDVIKETKFSPSSKDGFYDAGTKVTIMPPKKSDLLFGHWVIKENNTGNVSTNIREFSNADNPLVITLDKPTYLFGRFVGKWKRLPSLKSQDGIVVTNVIDGQNIKILQNGKTISEKTVGINGTEVSLSTGLEKQLYDVQIIITAPDGETVIFRSPIYEKIQAGDQFFY